MPHSRPRLTPHLYSVRSLLQNHGLRAWDEVARRMAEAGHERRPMACFRYYKTVTSPRQQPKDVSAYIRVYKSI